MLACSWPLRSPSRKRPRSFFGFHLFSRGIQLTFEKHIHVIKVVNSAVRSCRFDLTRVSLFSVCHRLELGVQLLIFLRLHDSNHPSLGSSSTPRRDTQTDAWRAPPRSSSCEAPRCPFFCIVFNIGESMAELSKTATTCSSCYKASPNKIG